MATTQNLYFEKERKFLVKGVKACAKKIYADAEDIVGNDQYLTEASVTIRIRPDEAVSITTTRSVLPDWEPAQI